MPNLKLETQAVLDLSEHFLKKGSQNNFLRKLFINFQKKIIIWAEVNVDKVNIFKPKCKYRNIDEKQFKLEVILRDKNSNSKVHSDFCLLHGKKSIFPKVSPKETGHAVSLRQSFPEKFVKIRQGKTAEFFRWDLYFSTKFYKCGYTMFILKIFLSLDPESDFASQLLACSAKLVGKVYQSELC